MKNNKSVRTSGQTEKESGKRVSDSTHAYYSSGARVKTGTIEGLIDARPKAVKSIKTDTKPRQTAAGAAAGAAANSAKRFGQELGRTEDPGIQDVGKALTTGGTVLASGIGIAGVLNQGKSAKAQEAATTVSDTAFRDSAVPDAKRASSAAPDAAASNSDMPKAAARSVPDAAVPAADHTNIPTAGGANISGAVKAAAPDGAQNVRVSAVIPPAANIRTVPYSEAVRIGENRIVTAARGNAGTVAKIHEPTRGAGGKPETKIIPAGREPKTITRTPAVIKNGRVISRGGKIIHSAAVLPSASELRAVPCSEAVRIGENRIVTAVRGNAGAAAKTHELTQGAGGKPETKIIPAGRGPKAVTRTPAVIKNGRVISRGGKIRSLKVPADAPVTAQALIASRIEYTSNKINSRIESGVRTVTADTHKVTEPGGAKPVPGRGTRRNRRRGTQRSSSKDVVSKEAPSGGLKTDSPSAASVWGGIGTAAGFVKMPGTTGMPISSGTGKAAGGAARTLATGGIGVKIHTAVRKMGNAAVRLGKEAGRKSVNTAISAPGKRMSGSEDETVQGIGKIYTRTEGGIRSSVKGVQTAAKFGRFISSKVSAGAGAGAAAGTAGTAAAAAGTASAGTAAVGGAGAVTTAVTAAAGAPILPWLLLLIGVVVLIAVIVVCVFGAGGVFFGGGVQIDGEDMDADAYLAEHVPGFLEDLKDDLDRKIQKSSKKYDIVRLYDNSGELYEATGEGIEAVMMSDSEAIDILSPLFSALLITKDFSLTGSEAEKMAQDLFDSLIEVIEIDGGYEYCGQDLVTGEGVPVKCEGCSEAADAEVYHALSDCPNHKTVYHKDPDGILCPDCDSQDTEGSAGSLNCGKTEHTHTDACYETSGSARVLVCTKEEHTHTAWKSESSPGCYETAYGYTCGGCEHCMGHSVQNYRISFSNLGNLKYEYIDQPIDDLNGYAYEDLSDEQREELELLEAARDIFEELCEEYGLPLETSGDLGGVAFNESGDRIGCQSVVDLALSQIGNNEADGSADKYVQLLGFASSKTTSWCASFVNWCMRNCPAADPYYPETGNNAYCPTVAAWFQTHGQWGDKNYTNLVPGDVIFYDFNGKGEPHHTGIVIGISGSTVYAVEGNKSDAVGRREVAVGSSSIYGYGLMNYGTS